MHTTARPMQSMAPNKTPIKAYILSCLSEKVKNAKITVQAGNTMYKINMLNHNRQTYMQICNADEIDTNTLLITCEQMLIIVTIKVWRQICSGNIFKI